VNSSPGDRNTAAVTTEPRSGRARRFTAELREQETVKPLELYFDLVFVLGFTQCTALMSANPSWTSVGQGMLVLAVLWWAWAAYAWLTSVIDPEEGAVRVAFFGAMAAMLIVALCVPKAFDDRALAFAIAYGVVRIGHLALYVIASRDDPSLRRSVLNIAVSAPIAVGLLVAASALDGLAQGALWVIAIAFDMLGPAFFGLEGWRLMPAHFAERHNLVIILALGESIVALGIGAEISLDAGVITAAVLGMALASAVWWAYFDVVAIVAERRFREAVGMRQLHIARDSYSYLHLPMIAGIVLIALGLKKTLAHVDDPLDTVPAVALFGGIALYYAGHIGFRLRNVGSLNRPRLVAVAVCLALIPLGTEVDALFAVALGCLVTSSVIAYEAVAYAEARDRIRHGS